MSAVETAESSLADTDRETVLAEAEALVIKLYKRRKAHTVLGVGVCLAGVINETGTVKFAPDLYTVTGDAWDNVELETELQQRLQSTLKPDLLVAVENDANALATFEFLRNRIRPIIVTLLTTAGIGWGVVTEGHQKRSGHVQRGAHFAAGEAGHVIVDLKGQKCRSGMNHYGCLETVASAHAIVSHLGLPAESDEEVLRSMAEVARMAGEGNRRATDACSRAGIALGAFLASSTAVLDPEQVVLWGLPELTVRGRYQSARAFQDSFEKAANQYRSENYSDNVVKEVEFGWRELETFSLAQAAAAAAMRHFLYDPSHWLPSLLESVSR